MREDYAMPPEKKLPQICADKRDLKNEPRIRE
jgi:hypothetical protein